jgi:hypothetical protein
LGHLTFDAGTFAKFSLRKFANLEQEIILYDPISLDFVIAEDKDLRQIKVEIQSAEAGKEYESLWLFLIDQKTFTVLMLIIVHKCSFIE